LRAKAKGLAQEDCRLSDACETASARDSHFDFTVISGYLECLIVVAVLVVLGLAEALLEGL
jgi:hypothetical protein